MKKALTVPKASIAGVLAFALFFAVVSAIFPSFARAETFISGMEVQPELTSSEVLNLMQSGGLQPGASYSAAFSEGEINDFLARQVDTFGKKWFIDRATVKLNEGDADITLHMLRPISFDLSVNASVNVTDGVATPVINSVWYGYFPAPASFAERVGNFLMGKKSITDWLTFPNGTWDSFALHKGQLQFSVSGPDNQ